MENAPDQTTIESALDSRNHTPGTTDPKPATRRAAVLRRLQSGERLTQVSTLSTGWHLAGDIHALRRYGWPICTEMLDRGKGRARIAQYSMIQGSSLRPIT